MGIIASVILHDIFRRKHGNVAFPVFLLDLFFRYNAQRLVIRGIGRDTQAFKVSLGTDPGGAVLCDVQFINIIIKLFRCLSEGFFFSWVSLRICLLNLPMTKPITNRMINSMAAMATAV